MESVKEKRRSVYEDKLYDRSLELLSKYEHILFSEDKKTAYMNEVYSVGGVKETIYFENIQKDLKLFSEIHPTEYSADEAKFGIQKCNYCSGKCLMLKTRIYSNTE